jgi:hypothetical protein
MRRGVLLLRCIQMARFGRSEPCCHIKLDQKELRIGMLQHFLSVELWSQSFLTILANCGIIDNLLSKKATSSCVAFFIVLSVEVLPFSLGL